MTGKTPVPHFATHSEWVTALGTEFMRKMVSGRSFTSEDLRKMVGLSPTAHPSSFGANFQTLLHHYRNDIRITGLKRSGIPSSKGRWLPVYRRKLRGR